MVAIPFPLSTSPGINSQESGGRLINCFAVPLERTAGRNASYHRVPGLTNFGTSSETGPRGLIEISGVLYGVFEDNLTKWTSAGGAGTTVATLSGTTKVTLARNNNSPPDQVVVTEDGAFTFTASAVAGSYPDADLPQPNSVCSIDGYLLFTIGDGRAFATDLNSTAVNSLSFGKAEYKPDGLVRGVPYDGRLFLFGAATTEIWTNEGLSPFPFTRATIFSRGLASLTAIAGHEDGFGSALIFVGDDNRVHRVNGYTPEAISPPDLDALIEAVADKDDLTACVYVSGGFSFWQLSSPTWTWTFNINNGKWHERQSHLLTRSRIEQTVFAFNKWLCQDTETGNVQQITNTTHLEIANPLRARIESGPVLNFPNRIQVARADFDFAQGVGIATGTEPIQTDPSVEISWTNDGRNWSHPVVRKLGKQTVAGNRVTVNGAGLSGPQGRRWRIDQSDPVFFGLMGGDQSAELRVK